MPMTDDPMSAMKERRTPSKDGRLGQKEGWEAGKQLQKHPVKSLGCILHLHFENLDKAFAPFGADWQDNDAANWMEWDRMGWDGMGCNAMVWDGGNSFGCLCLTDRSFNQ